MQSPSCTITLANHLNSNYLNHWRNDVDLPVCLKGWKMCFHKSGNKQVRKCLLIPLPVNKTGATGKKKQNNSSEDNMERKINRFPHWWVFSGQTILCGFDCLQAMRRAHSQHPLDFQISLIMELCRGCSFHPFNPTWGKHTVCLFISQTDHSSEPKLSYVLLNGLVRFYVRVLKGHCTKCQSQFMSNTFK